MVFSGLLKTSPLTLPYGRRKNGNCTCNTEWCDEHEDCTWECYDPDGNHMTAGEYNEAFKARYGLKTNN